MFSLTIAYSNKEHKIISDQKQQTHKVRVKNKKVLFFHCMKKHLHVFPVLKDQLNVL